MASVVSREAYFETGLEVLAERGYGGLKLAEVCRRLGVTTGSFYHYFPNWPAYTKELLAHWMQVGTVRANEAMRAEPDPRRRIDAMLQTGLSLPHGAEAAIRVWSFLDPHVHAVQVAVDQQRYDMLYEIAFEVLGEQAPAKLFAAAAVYMMVGYEQTTVPRDTGPLKWIIGQLATALESGHNLTNPDGD